MGVRDTSYFGWNTMTRAPSASQLIRAITIDSSGSIYAALGASSIPAYIYKSSNGGDSFFIADTWTDPETVSNANISIVDIACIDDRIYYTRNNFLRVHFFFFSQKICRSRINLADG